MSYKALDVEQIGHCYEGLLDHGCTPIDALSAGLIGPPGAEPELTIADLTARLAAGPDGLCEWLADKTRCNKTASALAKLLGTHPEGPNLARLRVACGHDDATVAEVLPFWGLLRTDLRGLPVVLLPGSQYVVQTSTRRNTGAQYTTKALAEEVVRYALEPLVYDPGPQNEADVEKWRLRRPAEILDLRVCDPAVGSGAILTAAGRYLADRLVESVTEHGPGSSGSGLVAGRLADLAAAPADDQTVLARREVVDHCLYGVDKNPVAAEMAKLSLWLTTMARERPFTFLDHAIQVGDSLLGITDVEQLRWLHLDPAERKGQTAFETLTLDPRIDAAADLARRLQELSVVTVRDAAEKQRLHEELQAQLADLAVIADSVVGAALATAGQRSGAMEQRLAPQIERIRTALDPARPEIERAAARNVLHGVSNAWLRTDMPDQPAMPWDRKCLHWPLAFPEVFLEKGRNGFDTMIGNPPYAGATQTSAANGVLYRSHLVESIGAGRPGKTDLAAFFFLRASTVSTGLALLTTNSISQTSSREVGLDQLYRKSWLVHRAETNRNWSGDAAVSFAIVWMTMRLWSSTRSLNSVIVAQIGPALTDRTTEEPAHRLQLNAAKAFLGSKTRGSGFVLEPDEAQSVVTRNPAAAEVVYPYLSGSDLNTSPDQSARRWVINFGRRSFEDAAKYSIALRLIEERVRPERQTLRIASLRDNWWQFEHHATPLYQALADLEECIAIAEVSYTVQPCLVSTRQVFMHKVIVIPTSSIGLFGVLCSSLHYWWTLAEASSFRTAPSYSPSDVFETFPQPEPQAGPLWDAIALAGKDLNEFRAPLMIRTNLGLTKTYNRFHNPAEHDPDVVTLRELHVVLDHAVRDAYGWDDLALDHHHWETPQGMRFTVSPAAKDELLDRLLELNHERYAAEVAGGLHDRRARRAPRRAAAANQDTLL